MRRDEKAFTETPAPNADTLRARLLPWAQLLRQDDSNLRLDAEFADLQDYEETEIEELTEFTQQSVQVDVLDRVVNQP